MAFNQNLLLSFNQIDDQRRTHNYDEFICTFISMLAQEGKSSLLSSLFILPQKPDWNPFLKLYYLWGFSTSAARPSWALLAFSLFH